MNFHSDFEYSAIERAAVQDLQRYGVEVHCITYSNDLCKCVEADLNGITIHLPNSENFNMDEEEYNTFSVAWDANGTGRDTWIFDNARDTAIFVLSAPHPDTHTSGFIAAWVKEMSIHAIQH